MKMKLFVLIAGAVMMLCGCGRSLPTEREGEQALRQDIESHNAHNNLMNLVNFHKTNGERGRNPLGVENYAMSYEGEIEFTQDCYWNEHHNGVLIASPARLSNNDEGKVKKGQRVKITGSVSFDKTDTGWQPATSDYAQ
jgi:hypothetical protein